MTQEPKMRHTVTVLRLTDCTAWLFDVPEEAMQAVSMAMACGRLAGQNIHYFEKERDADDLTARLCRDLETNVNDSAEPARYLREGADHQHQFPIFMRCANCGSENCGRDATVTWSIERQVWELSNVQDSSWCDDCGADDPRLTEYDTNGQEVTG